MTACLYYHPDGYTTAGKQIMGRHAAGASFLRAFLEQTQGEELWIQVEEAAHINSFMEAARQAGRSETIQAVDRARLGLLATPGVVFHPGPGLGPEAFQRSVHGHRRWSLCGITHTTCTAAVMDAITAFPTTPLQPWDALICTSEAVRTQVSLLLEQQGAYLQERLGATRMILPQLPVIPLGLHSDDFRYSGEQRHQARQQLGIAENTVVVLFAGRLSFHAKAHPLAMYQALEQAARDTQTSVHLLECGWHANETIRQAWTDAACLAAPSLTVSWLNGLDHEQRHQAWAAADVFCSLVDNIQETFGITPLEAMAAGLPVVVSDWDGYRDSVRDGVDGFRIPTRMPPGGLGGDLAARHALGIDSYDQYLGYTSAFVAVDVEAATRALSQLFRSPELRRRLGENGQRRVLDKFDWRVILPRYQELWQELGALRSSSAEPAQAAAGWPARLDPFAAFAGYASAPLKADAMLRLNASDAEEAQRRLEALCSLLMVNYAGSFLPTVQELVAVLQAAANGPMPSRALLLALPEDRRPLMFRALLWLLKLDLLRLANDPS
jgi:alpha-maltose-1-phosphate synthase